MAKKYHSSMAEECEKIIRNYVEDCSKEERKLNSENQLVNELFEKIREETIYEPSRSTIRRYLGDMNFVFHSPTHYDFEPDTCTFDELVTYVGLQKHICFFLEEAQLGTFFAKKLNDYYGSFEIGLKNYIHCVSVENLLICFYKKSTAKNVTKERLKEEIPQILSEFYLERTKKKT